MSDQDRLTSLEKGDSEPKERRTWLWILLALLLLCILGGAGVAIGANGVLNRPVPTDEPTDAPTSTPTEEPTTLTDEPTDTPTESVCTADLADGICCAEAGETYLTSPGECACVADPTDGVCCTTAGEGYPTEPGCPPPPPEGCQAVPTDGVCCTDAGESYPTEPSCEPPPQSCTANPADGLCCAAAGETYLTSPSECPCVANATDGLCCMTAGETHDNDPNECRDTNDPCAGHGGLQWTGQICACPGAIDIVTICVDGTKTDYLTGGSCVPDNPASCKQTDTGGSGSGVCACTWHPGIICPMLPCGYWADCTGNPCSPP